MLCYSTLYPRMYHAILYHAILYYTTMYSTMLYYTIPWCTMICYTMLYPRMYYAIVLYTLGYTMLYYAILCYTTLYYTTLYYTVLYCSILCPSGPLKSSPVRVPNGHPEIRHPRVLQQASWTQDEILRFKGWEKCRPPNLDSRTLSRWTLSRWTGRSVGCGVWSVGLGSVECGWSVAPELQGKPLKNVCLQSAGAGTTPYRYIYIYILTVYSI